MFLFFLFVFFGNSKKKKDKQLNKKYFNAEGDNNNIQNQNEKTNQISNQQNTLIENSAKKSDNSEYELIDDDVDQNIQNDEEEKKKNKEIEDKEIVLKQNHLNGDKELSDDIGNDEDENDDDEELNLHDQALALLKKQKQLAEQLKKTDKNQMIFDNQTKSLENMDTNNDKQISSTETDNNDMQIEKGNKGDENNANNKEIYQNHFIKKHIDLPTIENQTFIDESAENDEDENDLSQANQNIDDSNSFDISIYKDEDDDDYEVPVRRKRMKTTNQAKNSNEQNTIIDSAHHDLKDSNDDDDDDISLIHSLRQQKQKKPLKNHEQQEHQIDEDDDNEPELYESIDEQYDSRQHLSLDNEKYIGACYGKHTLRTRSGSCICEEGYIYGDPSSEIGCWKCDHSCHKNASCKPNGKCVCMPGLFGDGISACIEVKPVVEKIYPSSGSDIGGTLIIVNLEGQQKGIQPQILCRFGKTVYEGQIFNMTHCGCITPTGKADSDIKFAVSFNGIEWSKDFIFHYNSKFHLIKRDCIKGIIIVGISLITAIIQKIIMRPKDQDEYRPFLYIEN